MGEVALQVVQSQKAEKSLKQMEDEGYSEGTGMSRDVTLKEGDFLEVRIYPREYFIYLIKRHKYCS